MFLAVSALRILNALTNALLLFLLLLLQEDVESVEIKSAIRSDHSAITLSVNGLEENERGPSFWKFNSTLINDQEYCTLLRLEYKNWLEFKDVNDKRVLWDLVKYKIRQRTIIYSKAKARKKREKVKQLEETLSNCTIHCDNNPSKENLEELKCHKQNMTSFTTTLHKELL